MLTFDTLGHIYDIYVIYCLGCPKMSTPKKLFFSSMVIKVFKKLRSAKYRIEMRCFVGGFQPKWCNSPSSITFHQNDPGITYLKTFQSV